MKYLSVCSGIEAATVAWHGLGWEPVAFSEIDPFPAALLAHHYPSVPNLGDLTKYREWPEELLAEVDLLVGGTPCQAFSVAGLRKSLDDERGNLSLIYVHLLHHINEIRRKHGRSPAIALWENVPGVLSTKDNAFGCFISGLLGVDDTIETQDGKWPKAGFLGSEAVRVGYRVLDAQYFGVAQRRRRVFLVAVPCELVASLGERACPSEILSLRESVLGNPPTRGEARQSVAGDAAECTASGGGRVAFGGNRTSGPVDVATSCLANGSPHGRMDFASETFVVDGRQGPIPATGHPDPAYAISAGKQGEGGVFGSGRDSQDTFVVQATAVAFKPGQSEAAGGTFVTDEYAPTLQSQSNGSTAVPAVAFQSTLGSRGGDIYEDGSSPTVRVGSGVGIPSPPAVAFKPSHFTRGKDGKPDEVTPPLSADADKGDQDTIVLKQAIGFNWQNGGGYGSANDGLGITEEGTGPLQRCNTPAVAFVKATNPHSSDEAPRFEEAAVAACLNGWNERHNPPKRVVAFTQNTRDEVRVNGEVMGTVNTNQNASGRNTAMVQQAMQVRRLTPTECCRLQGFPDDHCDITFRKKPAADGPKYRALGNSMAVPCMAWLGYRIHMATGGDK